MSDIVEEVPKDQIQEGEADSQKQEVRAIKILSNYVRLKNLERLFKFSKIN